MKSSTIANRLKQLGNKEKARHLMHFFKTGPGQYGHSDIFAGLTVPEIRALAKNYAELTLPELMQLLQTPLHEARFLALLLLIQAYRNSDTALQAEIYAAYLRNTRFVNNWDLVDVSAEHIVGTHLYNRNRQPLYKLAVSSLLWDRRIAIVATFHFIKHHQYGDTLQVAKVLLEDQEDLIHKAVGWMLREVGKRDQAELEKFLKAHCTTMPRTMLRYAIERFNAPLRRKYLQGEL